MLNDDLEGRTRWNLHLHLGITKEKRTKIEREREVMKMIFKLDLSPEGELM